MTTVEGIGAGKLHPVQKAFMAHDALQCGFCTPGFIVEAKDLSIDDCQLAASQFMQMCQASLFLPFIFQAAPAPSAERIAQVVESATRMFLAAYQAKPRR